MGFKPRVFIGHYRVGLLASTSLENGLLLTVPMVAEMKHSFFHVQEEMNVPVCWILL